MKKENKLRKMKSSADHPDDDAHANNGNESGGPNGNNKGGSVAEKLYTGRHLKLQNKLVLLLLLSANSTNR